jgi:hypothetical protein
MSRAEQASLSSEPKLVERSKSAEESRAHTAACWERTQSAIERSREQLRQSDKIMKWCEDFGPHRDSGRDDSADEKREYIRTYTNR